ncbi:flavin-containing monooxygenase [Sphingomonas sp. MMS24-J13]|uniref:flavin-containing monooxygenase n=1 Tax=Sphingomonas sp. MMS24-J13 TaxID=3238686 RepID=UPI0038505362
MAPMLELPAGQDNPPDNSFDVAIVGAGFAGLYMLHCLREHGFRAIVLEAGGGVGGTWYWNRYPGARCDIPSIEYSYSFSPELEKEWRWSERYAAQPEILAYLDHVADRFDLRRDIRLNTRVEAAIWQEEPQSWEVRIAGDAPIEARFVVLATGNLSTPKLPDWPGMADFRGEVLHTAMWPEGADLAGKRVGVVGTGSSGIQAIPQLAAVAEQLTIFQRTPSFIVPASNAPLGDEEIAAIQPDLPGLRAEARMSALGFFQKPIGAGTAKGASPEERAQVFEESWLSGPAGLLSAFGDLLFDIESNDHAANYARQKFAELIHDPETARRVTPQGYPIGARRLVSEIGYFDALNRPNVELIDVREEPIAAITEHGVRTPEREIPIDALVLATGFHAMTGAAAAIDIVGTDGRTLRDEWADGPRAYLGLGVAGFPNLFFVTGPGSPSVLSNVVLSIEQHVEWLTDLFDAMRRDGATRIEVEEDAEAAWMTEVDTIAQQTLFPRANSWYHSRTRDGRTVFMPYVGGVGAYRARCDQIARDGYPGFRLTSLPIESQAA